MKDSRIGFDWFVIHFSILRDFNEGCSSNVLRLQLALFSVYHRKLRPNQLSSFYNKTCFFSPLSDDICRCYNMFDKALKKLVTSNQGYNLKITMQRISLQGSRDLHFQKFVAIRSKLKLKHFWNSGMPLNFKRLNLKRFFFCFLRTMLKWLVQRVPDPDSLEDVITDDPLATLEFNGKDKKQAKRLKEIYSVNRYRFSVERCIFSLIC